MLELFGFQSCVLFQLPLSIWVCHFNLCNAKVPRDVPIPVLQLSDKGELFLGDCLQVIFNTLRPRQNGHHFADDIFKCIFFNENVWISLKITLRIVP